MTEPELLELTVTPHESGRRLDRYVADSLPDLSRSYARQLIDKHLIQINGLPARPSTAVRSGDCVHVSLLPAQPTELVAEPLDLHVVYEDADLAVIDKPAGMVVHPAPGHARGTLVNGLLARYPDLAIGGDVRPGIVHRLDRDTSGLLVIARNDQALRHLQAQQQAHQMTKSYLAVACGPFREQAGVIDAPVGRHPTDRLRMAVVAHGRPARTHWRVLEELGSYTLLEVQLETGRTHQIRVHFTSIQRPILGDPLYGPQRTRTVFGLTRQFLHAYRLGFRLPSTGASVEFVSELPDDLAAVLRKIRSRHD